MKIIKLILRVILYLAVIFVAGYVIFTLRGVI